MRKLMILVLVSCSTVFCAKAQKGEMQLGAGVDVGLPLGNFGEGYGVGIGASAKGLYGVSDAGQVTLTLGFMRFGMKDGNEFVSGSVGLIPLLAGYRHTFGNLYAEGQVGLTVVRTSVKFKGSSDTAGLGGLGGSASDTNLGYGIGGGYVFDNWDLGLRFQGVSGDGGSLDFVALRVAYNFSL